MLFPMVDACRGSHILSENLERIFPPANLPCVFPAGNLTQDKKPPELYVWDFYRAETTIVPLFASIVLLFATIVLLLCYYCATCGTGSVFRNDRVDDSDALHSTVVNTICGTRVSDTSYFCRLFLHICVAKKFLSSF